MGTTAKDFLFNIVLFQPLIPQNTGNIGRLAGATNTKLHLIEPLGFELSDRKLKRAGLDYWAEIDLSVYENWEAFLSATGAQREQLWFFSVHADPSYYEIDFRPHDYLIFGNEGPGLSPEMHERYADCRYSIPMDNPNVRSLNLANAAAIVLYEARRQLLHLGNLESHC